MITSQLRRIDQRQPFTRRLLFVRRQKTVELVLPGPDLGKRLRLSLVAELDRIRPDHLPYDFACQLQLTADRLPACLAQNSIPASAPMTMEASVDPQSGGPD